MIEAMACGTPIIAFSAGSVPEVVDDGLSGFVVQGEQQAVDAIHCLKTLERRKVREQFEKRFTAKHMAQQYLKHYKTLIAARRACNGGHGEPSVAEA
jgi:glycosyltransferase involved in cell wall biosynthesis